MFPLTPGPEKVPPLGLATSVIAAAFEQVVGTGVMVGGTEVFTVTVIDCVVAHCPAVGAKV